MKTSQCTSSDKKQKQKEYMQELRRRWKEAEKLECVERIENAHAKALELGISASLRSIAFIMHQMEEQKLKGMPYIDTKTYNLWKQEGYRVRRGEKSTLKGLTWIKTKEKKGEKQGEGFVFPKVYNLFHSSQVEEIEKH